MLTQKNPFLLLKGALDETDISFLKESCKHQLRLLDVPCYSLLERLNEPSYLKIAARVQSAIGENINYLNDFYFFTDASFSAGWHMDTELFTFENAINAWILLSPDAVSSPLGIINSINESEDRFFHTIKAIDGKFEFSNLYSGESEIVTLNELEGLQAVSPSVSVGDILLFNPKKFHKTLTVNPKHCLVIKFVRGETSNCLSKTQVSDFFWPEVAVFNSLVMEKNDWGEVLTSLKAAIKDDELRKNLSSGFFPDRFSFYKNASERL